MPPRPGAAAESLNIGPCTPECDGPRQATWRGHSRTSTRRQTRSGFGVRALRQHAGALSAGSTGTMVHTRPSKVHVLVTTSSRPRSTSSPDPPRIVGTSAATKRTRSCIQSPASTVLRYRASLACRCGLFSAKTGGRQAAGKERGGRTGSPDPVRLGRLASSSPPSSSGRCR